MRRAAVAALLAAISLAGCAHLVQPRTWTSDVRTVEQQQQEYLAKELVRGLPEDVFRRWYIHDPSWTDPLRPWIRATRRDDGDTVYEIGSEAGPVGEVTFRDGGLDHWTRWRLVQESVVSTWIKVDVTPREVGPEIMARIVGLDPPAETLRPEERPDPEWVCRIGAGMDIDTLVPLIVDGQHGNRLERWFPAARTEDRGGRFATLAAGTRLSIERWDPVHGRRLVAGDGTQYSIDAPLGLDAFADVWCPAGKCVPIGAEGVVAQDLDVATPEDGEGPALAILPGQYRLPVWMKRGAVLPAGARVRIRRWTACSRQEAEIELDNNAGPGLPRALTVPFAPPGLFRPPAAPR